MSRPIRPHPRYRYERVLLEVLILVFLRLGRGLHVLGRENIPAGGPLLVLCNHIATVDPPIVGSRIPRLDVFYMAKKEAFHKGWNRFFVTGWNAFPVERHTADRASLRHALRILREGHVLVMFPEGSRSLDATMGRGFSGVGFLARHSGAPVIPAGIWGSENVLPKGSMFPRSADITVRFGTPVTLDRLAHGRKVDNQEATDMLMREVAALLPERYRGVYDGRPLAPVPSTDEPRSAA